MRSRYDATAKARMAARTESSSRTSPVIPVERPVTLIEEWRRSTDAASANLATRRLGRIATRSVEWSSLRLVYRNLYRTG